MLSPSAHCRLLLSATILLWMTVGTALAADDHWAFQHLPREVPPDLQSGQPRRTPVDTFLVASLKSKGLNLSPPADRATLIRRLTFDLTGLPPHPADVEHFVADPSPDAYSRAVERLLASPHYGERWGKYWLDVVGYADSNGYFNADSDRPFAYRYRDYVIHAWNADKPFDQFVREQLAGDELSDYTTGVPVTPRTVELFTATHFLRNAQDGSSESDGNPDERRVDRATALQGTLQITVNAFLGLTIQCCRCHAHKFEPIQHAEYYRLESIFYPAFPAYDSKRWIKPRDRIINLASAGEEEQWQRRMRQLDARQGATRRDLAAWIAANRPAEAVLFRDRFDGDKSLKEKWSATAPGDNSPGGSPAVALDSFKPPAALAAKGALQLIESGAAGDRWLVTRQAFDWKPKGEGEWIQATFDLVADRVGVGTGAPAERIAYFLAAHRFPRGKAAIRGNLLIDGNPAGGAAVHSRYPSENAKILGEIGSSGYKPGHRYGVRVTHVGGRKYRLEHIVDSLPEKRALTLDADDLPIGAFGFELCCGRSFVVDDVIVETSELAGSPKLGHYRQAHRRHERQAIKTLADIEAARQAKPGALAGVTDILENPPSLHVLKRGNYDDLGEKVAPAGLTVLSDGSPHLTVCKPYAGSHSTGRRLAFARWLTNPSSRASALLARVIANRIWQHHFGRGIVATPDNFGLSGTRPTHPELLNYLSSELVRSGWSIKTLHRLILNSAAYQQSSAPRNEGLAADPDNRLLWRYPLERLDSEAVRDSMLAVSGELDERLYGPYLPTAREADGAVVVVESQEGAFRRSVYLQQRRTQVNTFLELFDSPVIVNNCAMRGSSTVPLQSLALLNSTFVRARAAAFAQHVSRSVQQQRTAVEQSLELAFGRKGTPGEREAALSFLRQQESLYAATAEPSRQAWCDYCQMLLASNAFLYVE